MMPVARSSEVVFLGGREAILARCHTKRLRHYGRHAWKALATGMQRCTESRRRASTARNSIDQSGVSLTGL